ncbi:MAG: DUF3737 family protein [Coprococcus sp.]|nr:DUF3737 family protein [Coprococcus sp.]
MFAGPADGESALKESRDISLRDYSFSLRYPLWHVKGFTSAYQNGMRNARCVGACQGADRGPEIVV